MEQVHAVGPLVDRTHVGGKADAALLGTVLDDLLQPGEGSTAHEQDIGGVDLQEFLLRMLAPALGRNRGNGAFDQLQQCLLDALARYIAGDGGVVALA